NYFRHVILNGVPVDVPARALVLEFDSSNYNIEQIVHVKAVDDGLAQSTRTVAISHTVLSNDPTFDHAIVSNVEVTVHDNDQRAALVPHLDATVLPPDFVTSPSLGLPVDNPTKVLEGDPLPPAAAVTRQDDYFAVELATAPTGTVRVAINPQDSRVSL